MSIEYLKYFVKKIHSNCPAAGINDPVLTYTGIFIVVKFTNAIIGGVSGRDNFDDKIRCNVTTFFVKFFGHIKRSQSYNQRKTSYMFLCRKLEIA